MKKYLLLLPSLILLFTIQLEAQESVGFSDSTDFQYLIDYRLPDWGYSNFYINSANIASGGEYRYVDQEINNGMIFGKFETDEVLHGASINISPAYELYRESEQRTLSFNTSSSLRTNLSDINEEERFNNSSDETDRNTNSQDFRYQFTVLNNYYFSDNTFLITNLFTDIRYARFKNESAVNGQPNNEQTAKLRNINFRPSLGIGFGRIRNVTPIIRSLRLNERYKELGNNSFTEDEIQNTADAFTKVQGYQRTRDRFLKYFWDDVNNGLSNKLDPLSTYDMFYLNDVFNERLGNRFEGYQVSLSVDYSYFNRLSKQDNLNASDQRELVISRETRLNLDFDWYKNLNLDHQLNISVGNELTLPLERDDDREWINQASLNAQWLWVFADRFQLTTYFINRLINLKSKDSSFESFSVYNSRIGTNFSYFIENKMALNAGVSMHYLNVNDDFETQRINQKQFQWSVNAGISYYFNRNLY